MQGYELAGLSLFAALALAPVTLPTVLCVRLVRARRDPAARRLAARRLGLAALATALLYGGVCVDALVIEPDWPRVTRLEVEGPVGAPLRILHLSDLHLEASPAPRDRWLLEELPGLEADLIVLTGDVHQLGEHDPATLAPVVSALRAPLGVFACIGFDRTQTLREAGLRVLVNEGLVLERGPDRVGLAGLVRVGGRDGAYDAIAGAALRVVLNHTPDLAEEAAARGAHLYLCGHTHGGQVRVPGWGAIVTNSETGKRFEGGTYRLGETWIHTSVGLGLEPRPAPQVRFFCRPEVTLITVVPPRAS